MNLLHFAKRPAATLAALSLVLVAACSDSTAPDAPFSATGTSDDLAVVSSAFNSSVLESFIGASDAINSAVDGSMSASIVMAPSSARTTRELAARLAQKMTANFSRQGVKPSFASSIPAEYAGKTFEYDTDLNEYVATDRTGAPSNGVRFILYSVNPVSHQPVEPLVELGYVQLTASESGTTSKVDLTVVAEDVTYLQYTATATAGASSGKLVISGFVSNGTERADFSFTATVSNSSVSLSYLLTGSNGVSISIKETVSSETEVVTLKLEVRGPHGRVTINGTLDTESTFTVHVNGELFATITENETTTTIVGADGEPLSEEETQTLYDVLSVFDQGLGFLLSLVAPTF